MLYRILVSLLVVFCLGSSASAAPDQKLAALNNAQLSELVQDLSGYYKQSLDILFSINGDDAERQLGLRVGQQLLSDYDARVAGRCTKISISGALSQYITVALGRINLPADDDTTEAAATIRQKLGQATKDFVTVLSKFALKREDLRETGGCPVFEYDLETLYETPITVFDPKFLRKDRQTRTFLRLSVRGTRADGTLDVDAVIGGGAPKGRYVGVAKRDLRNPRIELSLMRVGKPLLLDGALEMTGAAYKDPITGEAAPKMPARVLSGMITVHDGAKHTLSNAVMLVARESDAQIGKALGGFKVPENAAYGTYLNMVLVRFTGATVVRDADKFAAIVDEAYNAAQRDNPIRNFHSTHKPLFARGALPLATEGELAFAVLDIAGDVSAQATAILRSEKTRAAAAALGARVEATPFYKMGKGKLRVQFAGRPASEVKFSGFEGFAKILASLGPAVAQEQQNVFAKLGIQALLKDVQAHQQQIFEGYKAMGPKLDAILEGVTPDAVLDSKLSEAMQGLLVSSQEIIATLANILQSRDTKRYLQQMGDFARAQQAILELAATSRPEMTEVAKSVFAAQGEGNSTALKQAQEFSDRVLQNAETVTKALDYLNKFSLGVELEGSVIGQTGKQSSWTWKWARTIPAEIEVFITGGKNESSKAGRREGD